MKCPGQAALVALAVCVLGALASARAAGVRWNATASMPRGLWMVAPVGDAVQRGDTVAVCPPEVAAVQEAGRRGYIPAGGCAGGLEPLVKPVAAIAGDVVTVSESGIAVNGAPVLNTVSLARDSVGRPLRPFPAGVYAVAPGQLWLLSGHDPRSFDSRYFGPVPVGNVRGVAHPLWVAG